MDGWMARADGAFLQRFATCRDDRIHLLLDEGVRLLAAQGSKSPCPLPSPSLFSSATSDLVVGSFGL